ncbi:MAG: hypothetical protein LBQ12_09295 [Deltaproteobacteria bacterium]|jgi:hypothetical protein|nr:hypothetical protein [Deltaproteobacteria bacterium]
MKLLLASILSQSLHSPAILLIGIWQVVLSMIIQRAIKQSAVDHDLRRAIDAFALREPLVLPLCFGTAVFSGQGEDKTQRQQ